MKRVTTTLIEILMMTAIIAGCGGSSGDGQSAPEVENRYRWMKGNAPGGLNADGITVVEEYKDGERKTSIGTAEGGVGRVPYVSGTAIVDTPGARNVHLEIDPEVKSTKYAGLTFTEPCVVEIRRDGTLLADKVGVMAKDEDGKEWATQTVNFGGEDVIAFFPDN